MGYLVNGDRYSIALNICWKTRSVNRKKNAISNSLTDREWEIIEPLLPNKKKTQPPRWTVRQILDGIF